MRNRDDRAGVVLEVMFEPRDGFGVEMVRRFVEQQDVRFLQQQTTQSDAPTFTT